MTETMVAPTRARTPRGAGNYQPYTGLKTIIPAVGWWAIFDGEDSGAIPLVCWALIGGSVVGMTLTHDGDGTAIPEDAATFVRYEYRG